MRFNAYPVVVSQNDEIEQQTINRVSVVVEFVEEFLNAQLKRHEMADKMISFAVSRHVTHIRLPELTNLLESGDRRKLFHQIQERTDHFKDGCCVYLIFLCPANFKRQRLFFSYLNTSFLYAACFDLIPQRYEDLPEALMSVKEIEGEVNEWSQRRAIEGGRNSLTEGGAISSFLGATVHEFLHAIGLQHTDAGIMSRHSASYNMHQFFGQMNGTNDCVDSAGVSSLDELTLYFLSRNRFFTGEKLELHITDTGLVTACTPLEKIFYFIDQTMADRWSISPPCNTFQIPQSLRNNTKGVLVFTTYHSSRILILNRSNETNNRQSRSSITE